MTLGETVRLVLHCIQVFEGIKMPNRSLTFPNIQAMTECLGDIFFTLLYGLIKVVTKG